MATDRRIVIAGAGQAGVQCAASLREEGFDGELVLIGAEADLPYQRPPLSKIWLKEQVPAERILLKGEDFYQRNKIELLIGKPVASIDSVGGKVRLEDGSDLAFSQLVIATGALNRRLNVDPALADDVLYLRTRAEADRIRDRLERGGRIAIIGAGFIGLEVAAAAAAHGCRVDVIDLTPRPMARVLSQDASAFFAELHRRAGVHLHLSSGVKRITGSGQGIAALELTDGTTIDTDTLVVGIGVLPDGRLVSPLEAAAGVLVDRNLQTAAPNIHAIGDCALFPFHQAPVPISLESVQNAVDQARCVARNILGRQEAYDKLPWFWSEQHGVKLQIAGLPFGSDRCVVRGLPEQGKFSVFHFRDGRAICIESINAPVDHINGRKLLQSEANISIEQASDPTFDLKLSFAA